MPGRPFAPLLAVICSMCSLSHAQLCGETLFQFPVPYPIDGDANTVVNSADIDQDSALDLIVNVQTETSSAVDIMFGLGNGEFLEAQRVDFGEFTSVVRPRDLDGDGIPDLGGYSDATGSFFAALGAGDGSFGPALSSAVAEFSDWEVEDLTGDGIPDLVLRTAHPDRTLWMHPGNGDGTFQPGVALTPSGEVNEFAIGDINTDGTPDILFNTVTDWRVETLLGVGDGTLLTGPVTQLDSRAEIISIVDINNDGIPDALMPSGILGYDVLAGQGDGSFTLSVWTDLENDEISTTGSSFADFDDDGNLDLILRDLQIFPGNGDGTFGDLLGNPLTRHGGRRVLVGDFDSDGRPDIALNGECFEGGALSIFLNRGDPSFQSSYRFAIRHDPSGIAAGDFNGDSIPDLVATNRTERRTATVLLGQGDGTFVESDVVDTGFGPTRIITDDFDLDAHLDLAIVNRQNSSISVLLGNGDGTFQFDRRQFVDTTPSDLASGDLNGDGVPDIAVAHSERSSMAVLIGNGNGGFQDAVILETLFSPRDVVIADIDRDGALDVVYLFGVFRGVGDGTFLPEVPHLGLPARGIAIDDLNADSIPDIVLVSTDEVGVALGLPEGGFGPVASYPSFNSPSELDVRIADMNSDGIPDIVHESDQRVVIFNGVGDGTFGPLSWVYAGISGVEGFAIADIDLDSDNDLVVGNESVLPFVYINASATACSPADLSDPQGVLNFNDVLAFLNAYTAMDPIADLADPVGTFNFNDVIEFLTLFAAGCP